MSASHLPKPEESIDESNGFGMVTPCYSSYPSRITSPCFLGHMFSNDLLGDLFKCFCCCHSRRNIYKYVYTGILLFNNINFPKMQLQIFC